MTQRCIELTKDGQRCKNQAKKDSELCAPHYRRKYGQTVKKMVDDEIKTEQKTPEPIIMKPEPVAKLSPRKELRKRLSPRRLSPRKLSPRKIHERILVPGAIKDDVVSSDEDSTIKTKVEEDSSTNVKEDISQPNSRFEQSKEIAVQTGSPSKIMSRTENVKFFSLNTVKNKLLSPRRRLRN